MDQNKRRILCVSAPLGESPRTVADAVAGAIRREFADAEVRVIDIFDYINPAARAVLTKGYASMLSAAPGLWGFLYEKESLTDSLAPAENFARSVRWDELRGLLAEFPPDVVAATHPFASAPFVRLKREGTLEVPLVALITDFTIHNVWVQEGISLYTVADALLTDELAKRGAERELVYPSGIPLGEAFGRSPDVAALKAKFGLDPDPAKKVILVLAKGWEPDLADRLLFQLSLLRAPHQILLSSAGNEELAERLRRFAAIYGVRAKLFGQVENLHEFMAVSDLAVTKGGGLTAAECLASGLPMVILDPAPGDEERTSRFLTEAGVARRAQGVLSLGAEIDFVLSDATAYPRMKQAVAALAKPQAARDAGRAIYLAAQNRAAILKRERERKLSAEKGAGAAGPTGAPGVKPVIEEIGQEKPADLPTTLTREAAKEILTGWIMNEKDARRRYEEALAEAERWQRRAEIAARRNEDPLAKEALAQAEKARREIFALEGELRRIAAEKAKITGRVAGGPPPTTTLGSPDVAGAEMESRFRNMELDDELERLKRRLQEGER
jgi:processive 1,2-diacylglycerol beta-glucosyltransferase